MLAGGRRLEDRLPECLHSEEGKKGKIKVKFLPYLGRFTFFYRPES